MNKLEIYIEPQVVEEDSKYPHIYDKYTSIFYGISYLVQISKDNSVRFHRGVGAVDDRDRDVYPEATIIHGSKHWVWTHDPVPKHLDWSNILEIFDD